MWSEILGGFIFPLVTSLSTNVGQWQEKLEMEGAVLIRKTFCYIHNDEYDDDDDSNEKSLISL